MVSHRRARQLVLLAALLPGCWIEREPPPVYPGAGARPPQEQPPPVPASATVLEGDTSLDPGALAAGVSAVNGSLSGCFAQAGQVELTVRLDGDGHPQEVQGASSDPACLMQAMRQAPLPRPNQPTVFRTVLWVNGGASSSSPASNDPAAAAAGARHDVFLVTIASVRLDPTRPDGRPWDEGAGSAPDVFVKLLRNGEEVLRSPTVADSLEPTFDAEAGRSLRLGPADELLVEIYDDDPGTPELITRFQVGAPGQAELERGAWEIGPSPPMQLLTVRLAPPRTLVGTGIRWEKRRGALEVLEVAVDSPAAQAGVVLGDRIVTVEGQRVRGLEVQALEALFRGDPGSSLQIELEHAGQLRPLTLERAVVFY
jgi:PDZ domain-containing protein